MHDEKNVVATRSSIHCPANAWRMRVGIDDFWPRGMFQDISSASSICDSVRGLVAELMESG